MSKYMYPKCGTFYNTPFGKFSNLKNCTKWQVVFERRQDWKTLFISSIYVFWVYQPHTRLQSPLSGICTPYARSHVCRGRGTAPRAPRPPHRTPSCLPHTLQTAASLWWPALHLWKHFKIWLALDQQKYSILSPHITMWMCVKLAEQKWYLCMFIFRITIFYEVTEFQI